MSHNDSNHKGRLFQKKVAELYRLLGAEVDEDIELCTKKVDLIARFMVPGSHLQHRTIVECKAERTNRAQNQRIMEMSALLELARRGGYADSAEIITLKPWSEYAKSFARQSGIEVVTFEQKLRKLIDMTSYMSRLSASVRDAKTDDGNPPLASYYVSIRGTLRQPTSTVQIDDLLKYLSNWSAEDNSQNRLVILGEYGSGKTSLCRMLAAELIEQFWQEPEQRRIPILLNLRDYTKAVGIESLITSFLDQHCAVTNPRYQLFEAMHSAGLFVVLLDGFDEMASRTDSDTIELNLSELEKLAHQTGSKLIITSRPEYFTTQSEQEGAWSPNKDKTQLRTRSASYDEIVITQWDDDQIEQFLRRRIGLLPKSSHGWEYYSDQIQQIRDLRDLSRRPILAEMIVKTLPLLLESGETIDRLGLYNKYLFSELQRQKIDKRRRLLLSDDNRMKLLEECAAEAYQHNAARITFSRAREIIQNRFVPREEDLIPLTRDFLSCSFLIRRNDEFVFSHKSIQEYLTAKCFLNEIKREIVKRDPPRIIAQSPLDPAVLSFMLERRGEIEQAEPNLINWVLKTRYYAGAKEPYLGGNAATLLSCVSPASFVGRDFAKVDLRAASLCGVDLRNTDFTDANLYEVDLRKTIFEKALFDGVRQIKARVHLVYTLSDLKNLASDPVNLITQLEEHFMPPVKRTREKGEEPVKEPSRIQVHGYSFGSLPDVCYLDLTIEGKNTFDQVTDYLLQQRGIKDAWLLERVDVRSVNGRATVSNDIDRLLKDTPIHQV